MVLDIFGPHPRGREACDLPPLTNKVRAGRQPRGGRGECLGCLAVMPQSSKGPSAGRLIVLWRWRLLDFG